MLYLTIKDCIKKLSITLSLFKYKNKSLQRNSLKFILYNETTAGVSKKFNIFQRLCTVSTN